MKTGKSYYNNGIEERRFKPDEVPIGYVKGRLLNTCKNMIGKAGHIGKHWYNNKIEEKYLSDTDVPADWIKGRLPKTWSNSVTMKSKQMHWYNNGTNNILICNGEEIPDGYVKGKTKLSEATKQRMRNSSSKGKPRDPEIIKRTLESRAKNNTFNTSKPEIKFYEELCNKYGSENIKKDYNKDSRYPWHCDFYVVPEDLFIELNLFPTHYKEPFNANNPEHIKLLEHCKTSPNNWIEKAMVKIWAGTDVIKLNTAKENNLNYQVIYNYK